MTHTERPLRRPRVDARESERWRRDARDPSGSVQSRSTGRPSRPSKRPSLPPAARACRVRPSDLRLLGSIHELLRELNDQYAAGTNVAALVAGIPVLAARCRRRAVAQTPRGTEVRSLERALLLVGNRGLEAELLQLLEDLTILKADLES